jgi:hypothetical protein
VWTKFDMAVLYLFGLLLALLVVAMTCMVIDKQRMLAEVVKAGADPIAARCAFDGFGTSGSAPECIVAAGRDSAPRQEGAAK